MGTITLERTDPGATSDANADLNNNWTLLETLLNGDVDASNLANLAVTLAKMAANSVDASKIVDGSVGNAELAASAVTDAKVAAAAAVAVSKLAAGSNGAVLKTAAGAPAWTSVGGNGALLYNTGSDVAWTDTPAAGEMLRIAGGVPTWAPGIVPLHVVTGLADVSDTVDETTVYTTSVPANTLGTTGLLRLTIGGDYLANFGTPTLRVRVKFGGAAIYDDTTAAFSTSATRRPWHAIIHLANRNATNVQTMFGQFWMNAVGTGAVQGLGPIDGTPTVLGIIGSDPIDIATDTTQDQLFAVTVQHSVANANVSFRRKYAALELIV